MPYEESRQDADKLLDQQKAILEKYAARLDFSCAKEERTFKVDALADRNQNTDLYFYEFRRLRIACRVRFGITSNDYGDITIRSGLGSGNATELHKIMDGWGDYMLYCWGTKETISEFIIIDLKYFRENIERFRKDRRIPNYDGYTEFDTFSIDKIIKSPCCVVALLKEKAV